jgi:hypothetical protein
MVAVVLILGVMAFRMLHRRRVLGADVERMSLVALLTAAAAAFAISGNIAPAAVVCTSAIVVSITPRTRR